MVNMNENGRKSYEQPMMEMVKINSVNIIATSDPTGETDPWGEG